MRRQYLYSDYGSMPKRTLCRRRAQLRRQQAAEKRDSDRSNSNIPQMVNSSECIDITTQLTPPSSQQFASPPNSPALPPPSTAETVSSESSSEEFDIEDTPGYIDPDECGVIPGDSDHSNKSDNESEDFESHRPEIDCLSDEEEECMAMELESDNDQENGVFLPQDENDLKTPLHESTTITGGDALLMCLALGLRHSLTWAAMVDLLEMINTLFDRKVIKASKYYFLKYMEAGREGAIRYHIYCPYCERYLGLKQDIEKLDLMACMCGTQIQDINEASTYFLSLNLTEQLKDLFKRKEFVGALSYRFQRKKDREDAYEDLYDGEIYKKLSKCGEVLSERYNLSYCFNTDGFPVGGKSGKQTCWPIYIQFNELPPELRSKYMLLSGIYVGKKDPNMKIFLHPFVEEANHLSSVGIDWFLNGKIINSKIIPLFACVDSPARSKILNMTQFNGWYGCTICNFKAESTASGLRYTIPKREFRERTHEEILLSATQADSNRIRVRDRKKWVVNGVKGLSPIHTLKYLDLVKGVRPDTMHSTLLGNAHHHTFILSESVGKSYYIGCDVRKNILTKRILSIKPPFSIRRLPRSLAQMNLWKASEWRSWILFYGVVCLKGIIPDEYVMHLGLLSTALHITLKKSVTVSELDTAQTLLLRYMFLYQQYFGKSKMVFNIHLLFHTKRSIQYLGPAWTHTAFAFEGANRYLLQMKRGTSSVAKEIAKKYLIFKALPNLCDKFASSAKTLDFCEKIGGHQLKSYKRVGSTVVVGAGQKLILHPEEFDTLRTANMCGAQGEVMCYDKIIHKSIRYSTASYSELKRNDDSYISIRGESKGRIIRICEICEETDTILFMLVREIILDDEPIFSDEFGKHLPIKKITTEGQLLIVFPDDISTQCVAMILDHGKYICDMPFGCYLDS